MKPTKLKTSVNHKTIFKHKHLSYHTKNILSKLIVDLVHGNETLDLVYAHENLLNTWPEDIVAKALDELNENDIIELVPCDGCDNEDCENVFIVFNPVFLTKACPYLEHCECCSPPPVNFNVNYN